MTRAARPRTTAKAEAAPASTSDTRVARRLPVTPVTTKPPVLSLRGAELSFGSRLLWRGLDLDVAPGEFLAVLGPNGTGKTSLLKVILGQQHLTAGEVRYRGHPVHVGERSIGYIPQQKLIDSGTPLRARDLVSFGVNGHRWGLPLSSRTEREHVDDLLAAVGATAFANVPVATLSGGEQQRVRVAQSIAGDPALLLCDEPLLSLDLAHQRGVSELIDEQRKRLDSAVIFVTHDVNPILGMVDRVLYLAGGQFRVGTPDEVLTSGVLSELYGTPVDVFRNRGRIVVVGGPEEPGVHDHDIHHVEGKAHS
jgi:zinc/manganese transport system ATP-binding protein